MSRARSCAPSYRSEPAVLWWDRYLSGLPGDEVLGSCGRARPTCARAAGAIDRAVGRRPSRTGRDDRGGSTPRCATCPSVNTYTGPDPSVCASGLSAVGGARGGSRRPSPRRCRRRPGRRPRSRGGSRSGSGGRRRSPASHSQRTRTPSIGTSMLVAGSPAERLLRAQVGEERRWSHHRPRGARSPTARRCSSTGCAGHRRGLNGGSTRA